MKISQFLMLIVIIVVAWASIFFTVINQTNQIHKIVSNHSDTIQTIKNNQYNNGLALETFIRQGIVCVALLPPNPTPTPTLINQEANKCFPDTKEIK